MRMNARYMGNKNLYLTWLLSLKFWDWFSNRNDIFLRLFIYVDKGKEYREL